MVNIQNLVTIVYIGSFIIDCIHWFIHNRSKDVGEYNNLCYEYETDVEL